MSSKIDQQILDYQQEKGIKFETENFKRQNLPKKLKTELLVTNPNLQILAVREHCKLELKYFIETFWNVIVPHPFQSNWHIDLLCKELEYIARRVAQRLPKEYDLLINIAPGSTKTMICSVMFPVWCWVNWHWMRFITGSYSADLSLESATHSRDIIESDLFQKIFPDIRIREDKNTKGNFEVDRLIFTSPGHEPKCIHGGNRYSTSVGGTITGFHGDILIWDDPINPKKAVSEIELKNANDWIDQTLSTRKTDKAITPTIGIMQRLHQNDPTGHIIGKGKLNVKHICIPGEIRNYAKEVKPQELIQYYKDGLMDPVRLSWQVLKDMEADLGQYGYAGQIGQRPTPPGGGMFKVDNIGIIQELPAKVNWVSMCRYWDKAATTDAGCYTVGVKMLRLFNGKFIVVDVKRGQWGTDERERIIRATAEADGPECIQYIEQEPGSSGKDSATATVTNLVGYVCIPDRPSGDKIFRADPYSVQVNVGNVQLLYGIWNQAYIEELRLFPFSTYKDQTDASSGAFNHLKGSRVAGSAI